MCRNKQKLARMLQEIREIEEQQTKLLKQLEESKRLTEERWEKLMGEEEKLQTEEGAEQ